MDDEDKYVVELSCGNCGHLGRYKYPKGIKVFPKPCNKCGVLVS